MRIFLYVIGCASIQFWCTWFAVRLTPPEAHPVVVWAMIWQGAGMLLLGLAIGRWSNDRRVSRR